MTNDEVQYGSVAYDSARPNTRGASMSDRKIKAAIKLLQGNGYTVKEPEIPGESEYCKAIRTGVKPDLWPPISMTRDELDHFRATHGIIPLPDAVAVTIEGKHA